MKPIIVVTPDQNFMRVFRQPLYYPTDYCFGGGHPVNMQMVDWFYPLEQTSLTIQMSPEQWQERKEALQKFIREKTYAEAFPNHEHLAITDFGEAFIIPRAQR